MSVSLIIINWIFVIIASLLMWKPLERVIKYNSKSIADYAVILVYLFNVLPVLLDCIVGVPEYVSYYKIFEVGLKDFDTCFICNSYVLLTLLVLWIYSNKENIRQIRAGEEISIEYSLPRYRYFYIDLIIIVLPLFLTVFNYGTAVFTSYTTLGGRGIASDDVAAINQLILVGIYFYVTRFYIIERPKYQFVIMILYFFILSWLNGKRYIIVTIAEMCFFMYQMTGKRKEKRLKLGLVLIVAGIAVLVFSAYYLSNIRVTSASEYLYGTLRIDFGRDDVTKFVINRELIQHDHILDYPGETFLSTLFVWVPRFIWPSKPYPHYRYLTGALLNRDILNLPSGMTPSIFEMSIANFYWFGIIICPLVLIIICRLGDRSKKLTSRLLFLLLITNVLTQSIDAMLYLLLILFVGFLVTRVRIGNYRIGDRRG